MKYHQQTLPISPEGITTIIIHADIQQLLSKIRSDRFTQKHPQLIIALKWIVDVKKEQRWGGALGPHYVSMGIGIRCGPAVVILINCP